jgi:TRAP-type C4-dicarboxylate transport system substrate-binding protein
VISGHIARTGLNNKSNYSAKQGEQNKMKRNKWLSGSLALTLSLSLLAGCGLASKDTSTPSTPSTSGGAATGDVKPITLKLSHQFPAATSTEGDFRGQIAMKFAEEVEKRTNGEVKIEVYPANSLMKAKEQYDGLLTGAVDLSVYPLDYAGGKIPQLGITLMPALVQNHKQAQAWENAEIGKKIEGIVEDNGVKILVWVWNAGGIGVNGDPIVAPSDVKPGMKIRAAGKLVEKMLAEAGAGITSMASSEIYSAMQTKVLDAAVTSASSFASYKLYEVVQSYTTSEKNTFWFMFEPLLISNATWEKLTPEQQKIIEEVSADLQPFAYQASEDDDAATSKVFREKGVNVVDMTDEAFAEWQKLAKPVWEGFAKNVEGGQELIDLALKAK